MQGSIRKITDKIVNQVLELKSGEKVCLLIDSDRVKPIDDILFSTISEMEAVPTIVKMLPTENGGAEPNQMVTAAIKEADVIIMMITHAMTHTDAIRSALKKGARVCNLRQVTPESILTGGITADYKEVHLLGQRIAETFSGAECVRITTENGTDVSLSLKGRLPKILSGQVNKPGMLSGLPDGEVAFAPLEGLAEGIIVDPYMIEKIGVIKGSLRIVIKNGIVNNISGDEQSLELRRLIDNAGDTAKNIAEFALGCNPKALISDKSREFKKKLGTVHLAFGDNKTLGGNVVSPIHVDVLFARPTVELDGRIVLRDGKLHLDGGC